MGRWGGMQILLHVVVRLGAVSGGREQRVRERHCATPPTTRCVCCQSVRRARQHVPYFSSRMCADWLTPTKVRCRHTCSLHWVGVSLFGGS
jgi:hypothetical protein